MIASSREGTFTTALVRHSIFEVVIQSLLYDTHNQAFSIALRLLTLTMPFGLDHLVKSVPVIMVILGRSVSWRDHPFPSTKQRNLESATKTARPIATTSWTVLVDDSENEAHLPLNMQPQAVVRLFLATVYNAWPSNILAFVREPVKYAEGKNLQPLYDAQWSEVYPTRSLASLAEPLLCNFHLHPSLVEHTSKAEIEDQRRWEKMSPSDFIAQAHTLAYAELLKDQENNDFQEDKDFRHLSVEPNSEDMRSGRDALAEAVRLRRENSLLRTEQNIHQEVQTQYLYREHGHLPVHAPNADGHCRHWPIALRDTPVRL